MNGVDLNNDKASNASGTVRKGRRITVSAVSAALLASALLACALLALTACGSKDAKRYELKGKVEHVDKRGSAVTIAHGEIRDYMPAMTMPFRLKDESLYDQIQAGDEITATLVVAGDRSWLEDVVLARATVEGSAAASVEPQPGAQVPEFSLTNQDGNRIKTSGYGGRAVLLTFIYTRCPLPDYCPLMTERFQEIEKRLEADAGVYAKTHLLSITVDPEYDKPSVLRSYGAGAGLTSFKHWEFATGTADEVKRVAEWFGLQYWPEKDQIIHSLRTAVIAPDGKLFKIYHGSDWKVEDVISDLKDSSAMAETAQKNEAGARSETGGQPAKTELAKGEPTKSELTKSEPDKSAGNTHLGVGVVESVDKELGRVQIDHEEIKDFMPAMNMPFAVKDRSLLDRVAPGDRVEFVLQATESGMIILDLKKRKP